MRRSDAVQIWTCAWLVGGCFNPQGGTGTGSGMETSSTTEEASGTTLVEPTGTTRGPTTGTGEPTGGSGSGSDATGTTGAPVMCGDGVIGEGEACDDGDLQPDDGCSPTCTLECGDTMLNPGEECDDGNVMDNDGCASDCKSEYCGDNIVQSDEECDDGNLSPNDGCSEACQFEACGDGVMTEPEECDDANMVDRDGCTHCLRDLFVFVSSAVQNGNFGGSGGADAFCTKLAATAGLPGTKYVALVATSPLDTPSKRLGKTARPYLLPTKELVAVDKAALLGGTLVAPIDVDEYSKKMVGSPDCDAAGLVWTGLTASGEASASNCALWLLATPFPNGSAGSFSSIGGTRFATCNIGCNSKLRLYCAESHP